MLENSNQNGVVLFAKQSGKTSFSSLNTIKHALHTKKVGHTGTLDSFASGLLVVCCGQLTRLASYITAFDKTYDAVIEFGSETDTLEWSGDIVKTAALPTRAQVEEAVAAHTGTLMQTPPRFSALHIHGERASDIARSGRSVELPSRNIIVYSAQVQEFLLIGDSAVQAVRVTFAVSKGTYIRSLARDIGMYCGSVGHLAGLRRISVGDFMLEEAAGAHLLKPFTIASVYEEITAVRNAPICDDDSAMHSVKKSNVGNFEADETELQLQHCVRKKMLPMSEQLAVACGFDVLYIRAQHETDFLHGRQLSEKMFTRENSMNAHVASFSEQHSASLRWGAKNYAHSESETAARLSRTAVFSESGVFLGVIEKNTTSAYTYAFVCSRC